MAKSRIKKDSAEGKLIEEIKVLGQTYGVNNVFSTFLEIAANCLGMEMDPVNAEERKNGTRSWWQAWNRKPLRLMRVCSRRHIWR